MMRYSAYDVPDAPLETRRAAILVDYDNLYQALTRRLSRSSHPGAYVTDALSELQRYLLDGGGSQTVLVRAYADFAALQREASTDSIERGLYLRGIEPCYAPTSAQPSASEMQLAVDAVDLLHSRGDLSTFVIVTGDRTYLPLVQTLRRYGRRALVAALEAPQSSLGEDETLEDEVHLDLLNLLDEPARRSLISRSREPRSASSTRTVGEPETFDDLPDSILYRTLEIAEEHFGQYDEVYLTPLLRKLSELLGAEYDPKTLISDLEEAGAVRLEKREGYPYDYTVLIVHENHPDVRNVREAMNRAIDVKDAFEDDAFSERFADEDDYEDDFDPSSYLDDYASYDGDGSFDEDGFDEDGLAEDGFAEDGFDKDGYHTDGHDEDGLDEYDGEMSEEER